MPATSAVFSETSAILLCYLGQILRIKNEKHNDHIPSKFSNNDAYTSARCFSTVASSPLKIA